MRSFSASLLSGGTVAALALVASSAFAHIDLVNPKARYVVTRPAGGGSKECPCGGPVNMIDPNRVCDVPAEQSHDTNRSANVTTFEAGEKISIDVVEYIDHSGRFRVAFDSDGADMTDFNSNILLDVPDDNTKRGATNNAPYTFEFTLPDMTCENCTLQVIQDMNGNTTTPVADPSKDSTYYTCADIRLVAKGTMGTDDGMDPADDPTTDPPPANNGQQMGANNGSMAPNAGSNMGTNLGTAPMMGDNTGAGAPMGTPATNNGNTSTGVGSLMPAAMTGTGTGNMLAPSNGSPIPSGMSGSSDSGGGCSISSGAGTPVSPFAALAVFGLFGTLAARRRARRAQ